MSRKLIVTDFDGTLATHDGEVSSKNRLTLQRLGEQKHIRVIATGRNLFSVRKVIEPSFPIDFVIFTTGAGIIHWPSQKILKSHHLESGSIEATYRCFKQHQIDFMIHSPIPDNHFFECFETGIENTDFAFRKKHYGTFCKLGTEISLPTRATQFVGVFRPEQTSDLYYRLKESLSSLNVVRATSPFDHKSLWVEVLSPNAAKHLMAEFLSKDLGVPIAETVAIGNDYNDEDLLKWAGKAFAVENAIEPLKNIHEVVAHVDNDGFSEAVERGLR